MWKAQLNRSIQQLRFVLKQTPDHHGIWYYVNNKLPELRMLNQNTFFVVTEINEQFSASSAIYVVYGDGDNSVDEILSSGISSEEFEKILESKVAHGLTLKRYVPTINKYRDIPIDIVEAGKHVHYMDDGF